jgi:hypothetical protein
MDFVAAIAVEKLISKIYGHPPSRILRSFSQEAIFAQACAKVCKRRLGSSPHPAMREDE